MQKHCTLFVISLLGFASTLSAQSEPVMDYATLLTSFDVRPDGRLQLEDNNESLTAVFLPKQQEAIAVLSKAGSETPLHVQDFYKVQGTKIFTNLEARGKYKEFRFTETGDYWLTFKTQNRVMTQIPFTVTKQSNGDEFDPRVVWYADGPWDKWAYVYYLRRKGANAQLEFRMWGRRQAFEAGRETDKYDVVLKKDGDVIAKSRTGYVGTQYWLAQQFKLENPASKGGRPFTLQQLTKRDGEYQFIVSKNQELYAVHKLSVANGKPVLHPRQNNSHQPRSEYIVPRYANVRAGTSDGGDTFWMERVADSVAKSAAAGSAASVAGPTPAQLKRWHGLPSRIDPNRKFEMTVTDVQTRTDTHFAVGEDLVVFGVGHPGGVKYLQAGDTEAQEIPDGETFSSTVFGVCGTKIVLTKRNQVAIFDTKSKQLTKIPTTDISLYDPSLRKLNCNGFLVGTVNKVSDVTDRNIVKVIDVSGTDPVIIPIKNSDYTHDQVTTVAIDSKKGHIAIASRAKKMIAAAKIAPLANQSVFDVSEFRGIGDFQMTLEDEVVTYADEDYKVRQMQLGKSPRAVTEEPIGRSGNGFWVRKGRLVTVTRKEKVGSRYPMMISDPGESPQLAPGTGTDIKGTSAKLGLGGSAAIAIDKTVFIAGTAKDSIGKGERLQMLTDNGWVPVMGDDGKPVWGSQVETSTGFMALKVRNAAGKTVIGYATYGQRIDAPTANPASAATATKKTVKATPLQFSDDNPYFTDDEKIASTLSTYLENEKSIGEAYLQAFGQENGAKKTVEGTVKTMQNNGHGALVNDYLRLSIYVEPENKPKSTQTATKSKGIDQDSVLNYLNGNWKAIRFSAQGEDLPDDAIESLELTFANGKYVMNTGTGLQTGNYEIDTRQSPLSITIHIGSGEHQGQKRHGSFKLLKDKRILMVFATNETGNPKMFAPDKTGNSILAVYQKR